LYEFFPFLKDFSIHKYTNFLQQKSPAEQKSLAGGSMIILKTADMFTLILCYISDSLQINTFSN